jgi:hypothetical protein
MDDGSGDGISGYQIVDTLTDSIVDKAPTEADALDVCAYYNDLEDPDQLFEVPELEYDDDVNGW